MKYEVQATKRYKKDYKRLVKSGRDIRLLERAIDFLASGDRLPEKYRDHELKGFLQGRRECHIGTDWLLIYRKEEGALLLNLLRTGTHRDTLGIE